MVNTNRGDDMARKPAGANTAKPQERVTFDYLKSPQFRSIRADGAIGGLTPDGLIHFALYSERIAIPRQIVQPVEADGTLGPAISELTVSRGSIVREMDVDVFVSPEVAVRLRDWIDDQLKKLEAVQKATASTTKRKKPVTRKPKGRK